MAAYYNEIEPYAAHVLECLIKDGVIADGDVDRRSIVDVHWRVRKASKGEPPRPFPAAGRKRSVFHLRGAY